MDGRQFDACRHNMHTDAYMRTTLNLDDELLRRAQELTGIVEKTALLHEGLRALITRAAARRLAALGGAEPGAQSIPRHRVTLR